MKDTDVGVYESQMRLNYLGTLYTIKEAARLMVENKVKGGKLVLCSSLAAFVGFVGMSAYTPSKCAIKGMCYFIFLTPTIHT